MTSNDLFEVINRLAQTQRQTEENDVLHQTLSDFRLTHVAYWALNLPTASEERPLTTMTCTAEWRQRCLQDRYIDMEPIIRAGLGGMLPIDWSTIDRRAPVLAKLLGEAQDFAREDWGLSFPIRGRHGEFALFSVAMRADPADWENLRCMLIQNLMIVAFYFHDWVLREEGIDSNDSFNRLSKRERDCLKWRALGKSDWEIAQILSISERTVKFHLENARARLGAVNTIHAVAKALTSGLIAVA